MEELMTYNNNLIELLKEEKDVADIKHFLRRSEAFQSQCVKDFNDAQKSIEDYENKIYSCKPKAASAVSDSALDAELVSLQRELDEGRKLELMLKEDLRVIINEIYDLELQRVSGEEEMQTIKKIEQDELRAQMQLSMYVSVTNIIPFLEDLSKISCHILTRDKKLVKMFELDPSEVTGFDACNEIWKIINL